MTEPRPYNRPLGLLRLAAVYLFVLALVWVSSPTRLWVAVGGLLVAAGEAWRVWAAGHLLKTRELVVSGPYRYTRNPLYLGRLLILTGFCVMARMPWGLNLVVLVLGYAVFFGYYLPRKERVEPARLLAQHGEAYAAYRDAVPALLPRLRPHGTNVRRWDRARFLRNREHWMIAGVVALTALFAVRSSLDLPSPFGLS